MKTQKQILRKLKQVLYRHLQKRFRANFRRAPATCVHNQMAPLNGVRGGVGVCTFFENGCPRGVVCDSRLEGGNEQAEECPMWAPLLTKLEIKTAFNELLNSTGEKAIGTPATETCSPSTVPP